MTTTQDKTPVAGVPDLRDIPLSKLASAPSGLAAAIALWRERAERDGEPAKGFNSCI